MEKTQLENLRREIKLMDEALNLVHDFLAKLYKNVNEMLVEDNKPVEEPKKESLFKKKKK